jgi:hypothetical protein
LAFFQIESTKRSFRFEPKIHQILVYSNRKIERVFELIQEIDVVFFQIGLQSFSRNRQVIVRNFREEQMMHDMAVSYVMRQRVDSVPELSIDGFESSFDVFPVVVIVHYCRWCMVLQVCHFIYLFIIIIIIIFFFNFIIYRFLI